MTSSKPDMTTTAGRIQDLRNRLKEAQAPVGQEQIEATHEAGRATARERILALFDADTFVETDALARHRVEAYEMDRVKPATDGVVTGYGLVHGRRVCAFSHDASIFDGAIGEVYAEKILKLYELATKTGVPVVGIYDSVGPRWQEGIVTAALQARLLRAAGQASGLVPQIAVVAGAAASLASLTVPVADLVVMAEGASLTLTPASTVSTVTGAEVSAEQLGGAAVHATRSGVAHVVAADDTAAVEQARELIAFLPENNRAASPLGEAVAPSALDLNTVIPDDDAQVYDAADIVAAVTDGDFTELSAQFAGNVLTGFAHINGRAVGIVATQPSVLAGCLSRDAARKAARFVRTCDAFNLPVVTLVDSPGFVPAVEEEQGGAVAAAAVLGYAYAEAQVPLVTVVTRKALGTAYAVLGSKELGADLVFAWPTAQIALADAATAAAALGVDAGSYEEANLNPYVATERGLVDAVITPADTREQVLEGLRLLERKLIYPPLKKHGNIPL